MKQKSLIWISLSLMVFCASGALAQTGTGSIRGTVRDPSGAVIPGATVTAINVDTNSKQSTATNADGYYLFPFLPPATYRIEARKTGFQSYVRENILLDVNLAATVDIDLRVGPATQAITVTAAAPMLESSTSSLGEVVSNTQMNELPIDGRNAFGFVALVPGVQAPYGFSQTAFDMYSDQFVSINGSRPNQNVFIMDGGNATEPMFNGPAIYPSMDSVQEYKIQTNNYSAEFSNSGGGVVNITTKSGTNHYHGSVYEFLRNSALDANDFFANLVGVSVSPYRFNQFGGTLGGPVPKTKGTFFFVSYEGLRWVQTGIVTGTVPTMLQRTGDFSQTFNASGQLINIYNPFSACCGATAQRFMKIRFPSPCLTRWLRTFSIISQLPTCQAIPSPA